MSKQKHASSDAQPDEAFASLTADQKSLVEQARVIEELLAERDNLSSMLDAARSLNAQLHKRVSYLESELTEANARTPVPTGGMRVPMDRWSNTTDVVVRVPLHDRAGRPVTVEVEPGTSVDIPATMRNAVRALAPQLVLADTE